MKPAVIMEPTKFRTVSLPLAGSRPDIAVPLVQPRPTFQRVVILQNTGTSGAFISVSAQELNLPGVTTFGQGFQLIQDTSTVVVLSPYQTLYGASAALVPTRLSVSASVEIPMPSGEFKDEYPPTSFRTITMPTIEAVQIVPGGGIPKRIIIDIRLPAEPAPVSSIFISDAAEELNILAPVPGGSFEFRRPSVFAIPSRLVFIAAPEQPLYAIQRPPMGPADISISVSNLHLPSLRGPTGIPGPDGEE